MQPYVAIAIENYLLIVLIYSIVSSATAQASRWQRGGGMAGSAQQVDRSTSVLRKTCCFVIAEF
jgi:hypothetical protein